MKISINTDLKIRGESVHVQTEDWGTSHKKLVARVFKQGQMVKSFEVDYQELQQPITRELIKESANHLHQQVIDWVHDGCGS